MTKQCCAMTKKGTPCPIGADRLRDGQWLCHVHDPEGVYRQQQDAKGPRVRRRRRDREPVGPSPSFINPLRVVNPGVPGGDAPF